MTCETVRRKLPLFVGDDLEAAARRPVAAHLETCDVCRAIEQELAASRQWLESVSATPFSESDYATMRQAVWRRIEGRGLEAGTGGFRRLAVAATGILAAVIAAVFLLHAPVEAPRAPVRARAAVTEEPAVAAAPARAEEKSIPDIGGTPSVKTVRSRQPHLATRAARPDAESSVARIEFQTANPHVRIIWLVNKGEAAPATRPASRNEEVS